MEKIYIVSCMACEDLIMNALVVQNPHHKGIWGSNNECTCGAEPSPYVWSAFGRQDWQKIIADNTKL